jgi:N-acetyl-gamma-glutamylphosphate reductase
LNTKFTHTLIKLGVIFSLKKCIIGLPDAASIEAASWVEPENDRTVIIDASTAFRVDETWDYGFPGEYF